MFAGQMACEALNWGLKRWIKEERPKRTFLPSPDSCSRLRRHCAHVATQGHRHASHAKAHGAIVSSIQRCTARATACRRRTRSSSPSSRPISRCSCYSDTDLIRRPGTGRCRGARASRSRCSWWRAPAPWRLAGCTCGTTRRSRCSPAPSPGSSSRSAGSRRRRGCAVSASSTLCSTIPGSEPCASETWSSTRTSSRPAGCDGRTALPPDEAPPPKIKQRHICTNLDESRRRTYLWNRKLIDWSVGWSIG